MIKFIKNLFTKSSICYTETNTGSSVVCSFTTTIIVNTIN